MQRCVDGPERPASLSRPWAALALAAAAALGPSGSLAQAAAGHRSFPQQALRGELRVEAAPQARLDGEPVRLAPGARIRGEDNLQRLPAALTGAALIVHYTREASTGLLMDVWILNAAERVNEPWPRTPQQAQQMRFDALSQRWSRP